MTPFDKARELVYRQVELDLGTPAVPGYAQPSRVPQIARLRATHLIMHPYTWRAILRNYDSRHYTAPPVERKATFAGRPVAFDEGVAEGEITACYALVTL